MPKSKKSTNDLESGAEDEASKKGWKTYTRFHPILGLRRVVQVLFFLLFNAGLAIYLSAAPFFPTPLTDIWLHLSRYIQSYLLLVPVLQTYSNPMTVVVGVFSAMQNHMTNGHFPFIELGVVLIVSILVGRWFCGWACPLGTIQDLLAKVPISKVKLAPSTNQDLTELKYWILGLILLLSSWLGVSEFLGIAEGLRNALGPFADEPFNVINPAAIIDTLFPWMIKLGVFPTLDQLGNLLSLPLFFWIRVAILTIVIIFSLFIPRAFCRYFCPMGALMGVFSKYKLLGFQRKPYLCTEVRDCEKKCPMEIRILKEDWAHIRSRECINCGICWAVCPRKAIKPTAL